MNKINEWKKERINKGINWKFAWGTFSCFCTFFLQENGKIHRWCGLNMSNTYLSPLHLVFFPSSWFPNNKICGIIMTEIHDVLSDTYHMNVAFYYFSPLRNHAYFSLESECNSFMVEILFIFDLNYHFLLSNPSLMIDNKCSYL
ncbi:MAG TPA: hypothetical protein VD815_05200 [Candidatus Saccharimonadales bacterium]|nr:hypothetical protein [Candidatus Saccharimonadales bacterium]